jgi:hypothetical protein
MVSSAASGGSADGRRANQRPTAAATATATTIDQRARFRATPT